MVHVGLNDEGVPDFALRKLENGYVVPDASIAQIHREHQRQPRRQIVRGVLADEMGYDYLLHPEHHFSLLGSISPHPVATQTAVAAQTEDIRLLQMANILPWHEPVRLAEQIAMLDILSKGRAEVGIGCGFGAREAETLGQYWGGTVQDATKNRRSFREKYELLRQCWTDDFVDHHGPFHDVPPTYTEWENNQEYHYLEEVADDADPDDYMAVDIGTTTLKSLPVFPQPYQEPHPQIWRPTTSPRSIEWAARRGINGCFHCATIDHAKNTIDHYYEATAEAGWPDHRPEYDGEPFKRGWDADRRRGIAAIVGVFNTEVADEETVERWKRSLEFDQSQQKSKVPADQADKIEIGAEKMLAEIDDRASPIVGDTEEIIDQLATFRETCGYEDFVIFVSTNVVGITHEESLTQARAFAEGVVPYLREQSAT